MNTISRHIFGLVAAASLLTTSCTDNITLQSPSSEAELNTEGEVVFFVRPYSRVSSRADNPDFVGPVDPLDPGFTYEPEIPDPSFHISDGSHIDVLKFAVYEITSDGHEKLCTEYQKFNTTVGRVTAGIGQNVYDMGAFSGNTWPMEVRLLLDPFKKYRVVFWAQNSSTSAYDSSDFTDIKVSYKNATNNDELRDAYSAVVEISGKPAVHNLYLHRVLAQINIGTAGWDYEGAGYLKPDEVIYARSKVVISGVADHYNALHCWAYVSKDATGKDIPQEVTFDYERMPAFTHLIDYQWSALQYTPYRNEEFLRVNTDENTAIEPYKGWADYDKFRTEHEDEFSAGERPATETFKYLSMCYVLVPTAQSVDDNSDDDSADDGKDDNDDNGDNGAVLSSLTFYALGQTDKDGGIGETFTIKNVPVQRNWRTNILSDNLFVANMQYHVYIVPTFCGDYNNVDDKWRNSGSHFNEDDGWLWTGPADPNKGFNESPSDEESGDYGDPGFNWPDDYYDVTYDLWAEWVFPGEWNKVSLSNRNGVWSTNEIAVNGDGRRFRVRMMEGPNRLAWFVPDERQPTMDGDHAEFQCVEFTQNWENVPAITLREGGNYIFSFDTHTKILTIDRVRYELVDGSSNTYPLTLTDGMFSTGNCLYFDSAKNLAVRKTVGGEPCSWMGAPTKDYNITPTNDDPEKWTTCSELQNKQDFKIDTRGYYAFEYDYTSNKLTVKLGRINFYWSDGKVTDLSMLNGSNTIWINGSIETTSSNMSFNIRWMVGHDIIEWWGKPEDLYELKGTYVTISVDKKTDDTHLIGLPQKGTYKFTLDTSTNSKNFTIEKIK